MRKCLAIGAAVVAAFWAVLTASASQMPAGMPSAESILREYTGVYRWERGGFLYLQLWDEFSGFGKPRQLTAFDETGEIRTLYPSDRDQFFAGPGVAVSDPSESRIGFLRDQSGRVTSLTWQREHAIRRTAARVEAEKREDVKFSNGKIRLAGTLIKPAAKGRYPAIILVHGSGAENREFMLPFARFLIRRGIAVLGYDKRGVGESTGDWNTASFPDLAGDVVAAFNYLKARRDIDRTQIGLLGVSQAGWVMPLAAVRARQIAFLISISGAGIPPEETTIDQAQNEMKALGMRPTGIAEIVQLMKLQYAFAKTGRGWERYAAAREKLVARLGRAPDTFPGTPDHPSWQAMRRLYFHDPAPALRQLRTPTLAIFGELDNNIVAQKNKDAWDAAFKAGAHPDYTLKILAGANHFQWEAKVGSNAEMASLRRVAPEYFRTIQDWLAKRVRGFNASE